VALWRRGWRCALVLGTVVGWPALGSPSEMDASVPSEMSALVPSMMSASAPSEMAALAPSELAALAPSEMLQLVGRLVRRSGRFGQGVVVLGAGRCPGWRRELPALGFGGHG